ncbi:MAG: TonB-dependent receptor [Paludibacter sp.]|jgi:iron complex outermembrane receptor protein|nr:TonB-dependent receptor [Paludibacter sp.]
MKKTLLFTAAIAGSLALLAQRADSLSINLQQISVTAERAKLYSPQARVLQVIGKQEIEKLPVTNIDELLETVAGIDIRNRGVGGTQADISIRGGSFDQVLILLNGVNITDPHTGHYNLDIPVELADIQRIEILQGSAARIYGPNAFSGAINIITSQPDENFLALRATAGSFNTFSESVSANFYNFSFSISHKSSDGYIENTDYNIKNVLLQLHSIRNENKNIKSELNIQFGYQAKDYGANGFYSLAYPNQFDHTQTVYCAINLNHQFSRKWDLSVQLYARDHYDRFELFRNKENAPAWYTDHNYHTAISGGGKATATFIDKFGKILFGIDYQIQKIESTVLGKPITDSIINNYDKNVKFAYFDKRTLPTVFADYSVSFGKFFLSAGAAGTFNKQFGAFVSGGADIAYNVNQNLKFFLSANNAVRLPTFTDLYYKSATQRANPDLKPEKSLTFEAGGKYNRQNLKLNASAYYRLGQNIIDWVKPPHADSIIWYSRNLTEVNALGAEFSAKYAFYDFFIHNVSFDYSFVNLDKKAEDFDSKYALDYLKHKAVFGLQHKIFDFDEWDNHQLSCQWRAGFYDRAGNYSDFVTNTQQEYKPYFTADVRLLFETEKLSINLDFNNFTNTQYVDYGGLAQPRFNFLAGVRVKL